MATKYTAHHAGQTFTRKSERTYTHLVIAKPSVEYDIARANETASCKTFRSNYEFYCREANEATRQYAYTPEKIENFKRVAAMTLVEYRNEWIAERLARIEADQKAGHYDTFGVIGWAGRPDLATKSAAAARGKPWNKDVTIVEVEAA